MADGERLSADTLSPEFRAGAGALPAAAGAAAPPPGSAAARVAAIHAEAPAGACDGEGAGRPDGFQNQLPQYFAADIMSFASMGAFLMCQRIGGTIVKVRRIRIVLRAAP